MFCYRLTSVISTLTVLAGDRPSSHTMFKMLSYTRGLCSMQDMSRRCGLNKCTPPRPREDAIVSDAPDINQRDTIAAPIHSGYPGHER